MTRQMTSVKVEGLKGTLANLKTIEAKLRDRITKKAARSGAQVIRKMVASQIYTGIKKATGLLGSGLGVIVTRARSGNRITGYVVERKIKTTGKSKPARIALSAAMRGTRTGGRVAPKYGAFYWRFLEFGTAQRTTASGANRGASPATGNVRSSFSSASALAIDTFRRVLIEQTNKEAQKLPSTKGAA